MPLNPTERYECIGCGEEYHYSAFTEYGLCYLCVAAKTQRDETPQPPQRNARMAAQPHDANPGAQGGTAQDNDPTYPHGAAASRKRAGLQSRE